MNKSSGRSKPHAGIAGKKGDGTGMAGNRGGSARNAQNLANHAKLPMPKHKERDGITTYLLLCAILALGLILAYYLYSGPFYSFDDLTYISLAHNVLLGGFNPLNNPYSYGFLVPLSIAASFAAFGVNVFASILPSLAAYLAIVLVSFAAAKKLYGNRAGLLSAFLAATAPFVVGYSTRVLPDMGLGLSVGLSLLFFVYARSSTNKKIFYFLSGTFAAITVYVKMVGLAYIIAFATALVLYRLVKMGRALKDADNSAISYPLAGMLVMGAVFVAIISGFGGSALGTIIKYGANQAAISHSTIPENMHALYVMALGYSHFGPSADPQMYPLGLTIIIALAGTVIGFAKRDRIAIAMSAAMWMPVAYLFFGTVTISRYTAIYAGVARYFIMVAVPMVLLACYAIIELYNASQRLFGRNRALYPAIMVILVLIVSYVPGYATLHNYNTMISGDTEAFSAALMKAAAGQQYGTEFTLVVTGTTSSEFLQFLSGYSSGARIMALNTSSAESSGRQLAVMCAPQSKNTYIAVAYDSYSEQRYGEIFDSWISRMCKLRPLGNFTDAASSGSAYNSTNVHISLYKVVGQP
jgi:hypothetical protein